MSDEKPLAIVHAPLSTDYASLDFDPRQTSPEAATKRLFVQHLFSDIAFRYDWFNRLASCGLDQRWRRAAMALGEVQSGQRILDVCAGTGDLALMCAARQQPVAQRARAALAFKAGAECRTWWMFGHSTATSGRTPSRPAFPRPASRDRRGGRGHLDGGHYMVAASGGIVVGIDMNRNMLTHAQRKQDARRLQIEWLQGDAEALPFADRTFDRVLVGFSTRNLSNLTTGLREMVRVLRPGGRLIILETGYPANPLMRFGYQAFLLTGVRVIGWALTGRAWPFTYLARSVQAFLTPQQFVERLQGVATHARYVPLSYGLASVYLATKGST